MWSIARNKVYIGLTITLVFMLLLSNIILVRNAIYDYCVEAIKIKSLLQIKNYHTYETSHFIIKYKAEDKNMVPIVAETIEKDVERVLYRFNDILDDKVEIIIYPDLDTMREQLNLLKTDRPMGIYYGGILHILSPKAWIQEDTTQEIERIFAANGPMVHELVHSIVDKKAHGNFPIWFTEGVALYYENELTGYEWGKNLPQNNNVYTLTQLKYNFKSLDQDMAYRQSFNLIKKIADIHGEQKIIELIELLGAGKIGLYSKNSLEKVIESLVE